MDTSVISERTADNFFCVIELNPGDYADHTYDFPNGSAVDLPEEWNAYWKKCLSDSGLEHLKAISPGSYFVAICQLQASDLRIILKCLLKDVENPVNELNPLCGGLLITDVEEILITPKCCGDLESIRHWQSIPELEAGKWHQLWIGHPWVYVKREQGKVYFSQYTEKNPEDVEPLAVFTLSEAALSSGMTKIQRELVAFTELVLSVLEEMQLADAPEIARQLVGHSDMNDER